MDSTILEQIGLTKSEIKVYLAMLELGSSSTGKIVERASVASSKVYEILDKLIDKGLASYIVETGVKLFQAANPDRLKDYLSEKERDIRAQRKNLDSVLPELRLRQELSTRRSEATIFKGIKGIATAYEGILKSLKKGDEYYVMGVTEPTPEFTRFIRHYHQRRAKQGIRVKILFSSGGRAWADNLRGIPLTEVRFSDSELLTSSFVLVYRDVSLIIVSTSKDMTAFRIESREVAQSFRSHFEQLWNQNTFTLRGFEGIQHLCEDVLATGEDLYLIGATGDIINFYPDYYTEWTKRRVSHNIKLLALADQEFKEKPFFSYLELTDYKFLPKEYSTPNVIWVYGDTVANVLWAKEPTVFMIKNKQVADHHRRYYEMLKRFSKGK